MAKQILKQLSNVQARQISIILLITLCLQASNAELRFVTEIYRHGARGPLGKYYDAKNQSYWGGQLTPTGMRQHLVLGQTLREEYIDKLQFLSKTYNYSEIIVRSTDVNRTIQSAYSQLYGLYPLGTGPEIPKNLTKNYLLPPYQGISYKEYGPAALLQYLQPIPDHVVTEKYDTLLNPFDGKCKNLDAQIAVVQTQKAQTIVFLSDQFSKTLVETQKMINSSILTIDDLEDVFDVLEADLYNGRKMPDGFSQQSELWRNISFVNDYLAYFPTYSQQVTNLVNNELFKYWIQQLDNSITGDNGGLKWLMLSAHDSNLQFILPGLNITSPECVYNQYFNGSSSALNCQGYPIFASNLIIEMHYLSNNYYIKIKYNGKYQNLCERKNDTCIYTEFRDRVLKQTYSKEQYDTLCLNTITEEEVKQVPVLEVSSSSSQQILVDPKKLPGNKSESLLNTIFSQEIFAIFQFFIIIALLGRLIKQKYFQQKEDKVYQQNISENDNISFIIN